MCARDCQLCVRALVSLCVRAFASCVCVRLLRHVDWAPTEDELQEAAATASEGLPTAIVEVGTLYRGEPIALHIVAAQ